MALLSKKFIISVSLSRIVAAMVLNEAKPEFSTSRYHFASLVFASALREVPE